MGAPSQSGEPFEPAIAGFFCQKCGKKCLSHVGESQGELPENLKSVRIICAEKVGPDLIKQAFHYGADGVLICGCLIGKCDTLDGNAEVLAHIHQTKQALKEMGLAQGRLRQEWICTPDMAKVPEIIEQFSKQLHALGPCQYPVPEVLSENV